MVLSRANWDMCSCDWRDLIQTGRGPALTKQAKLFRRPTQTEFPQKQRRELEYIYVL